MRLAGKMAAGFYPTPPTVTALLATLLVAPRGGRLLDPCAGLGVFAATLARDLGLESYGVEINDTRATEAAMPLDHLLHTDALKLMMTHESVGLLALNPPYDYDDEVRRLEHAFLLKTTPYVQPGGVLAFLVPQQRLSVSASYLTAHYTDIRLWRFPDEEYRAYRQVVLLARKKAGPERDAAAARALTELAKGELEPLTAGACPPYAIPRAGAAPLFAASEFDPLSAAREAGAESWPTLAGRLWPREAPRIRPLMPMKKGHVAQFAVAGLLSNVVLHDEAGDPFVVKGQAEKATVVKVTDGEESVTRTERDVLQTRLTLLDVRRRRFVAVDTGGAIRGEATARAGGEEREDQEQAATYPALRPLGETMGLDTFLERFKESITARILADYRPLYTPLQRDLYADRLRLLKRRLMGAQSDVVRAVALALRSGRRGVFVNGKMGTGKCLHPATRVSVNGVVRTMEEVWEAYAGTPVFDGEGEIALPREPLFVPSLNEESGRVEMRPVEHLWRQRVREPLRRVRLVDGRTIRTTMAHKFLTPSGWTSEIAPGSYIAVPRREPAMPDAPTAPLDARFMAWLVAEGHERRSRKYPRSAFMEIAQVDRAVLESLVDPARALGMTGLRVADPRYGRSAATLRATATRALPALAAAGYAWGLRSAAKRVPTCIMQADDRAARDFLRAYVDAEGSISSEPQRATLEITTASVGMAHDLCTLLRRVGVYSRIASKAAAATNGSRIVRTYFRVVVSGSALRAFAHHIGCSLPRKAARLQAIVERPGNDNIDTIYIADLIGAAKRVTGLSQQGSGNLFSTIYVSGRQPSMNRQTAERLAALLFRAGNAEAAHLATRLRSRIDGDVFYVRVASVEEEDYEGDVYDLHVPETHNFTADHVVVHNTTVSLAAAWCHGARSILVLCPPHLTRKWQREVLATVPGARVGIAVTPADLHAILDTPADRWHQGPLVTIISRERAKLRYATVPCATTRTVRVLDDDGALVTRARLSCPDCGRLLLDKEGVPLTMAILKRRKQYCPDCRAALWQADRTGPRRVALADYIKAQLPRAYDLLIADECFPAGTPVATATGSIPIERVRPGDMVLSHDGQRVVEKRVVRTIRKRLNMRLVRVRHDSGDFVCTANHRIFTARGYVAAGELLAGDSLITIQGGPDVHLCSLRQGVCQAQPQADSDLLRQGMRPERTMVSAGRTRDDGQASHSLTADARVGAYEAPQRGPEVSLDGDGTGQSNGTHIGAWRQWQLDEVADPAAGRDWLEYRVWDTDRRLVLAVCASGFGLSGATHRRGVRRSIAPLAQATGTRPAQGRHAPGQGMVAVPLLEQPDREQSTGCSRLYPDSRSSAVISVDDVASDEPFVYDLEIEDTHRYFAAGVLVSNCHQFKGRGTAQGFALATLAGLIPQTLALTGTLFNGLSTSLFYLMYRLIPEIRAEFGVNDETAWAARYGILERVTVYRENEEAREDGAQSKRRSGNTRVEEKPGIMPALVVRLVEHTVFMNLADVAEGLPPYDEGFTLYDMTDAQASCYAALYRTLHDELIAALHNGGAGKLLGAYLQKLLTYADTCWDARWTDEPAVGRQLDATEVYPKEQALADYCRRERGRARRVLVYVKHVGERDVTARLARVLTDAGCRVAVLKSDTVPSDEREEWFERQVRAGVDVVITNPTLVETGLDLLAFPSIRFHEIEYDTNTLSQATKRSWRIGQDRPVEVTFTGYRGTIQTNGLARVASKLRASYQADGDLMSGGLADFGDDGDFFRDLARSIAAGEGTNGDGLEALYAEARAAAADGGGEILTDEEREARERVAVAVVPEAGAGAGAMVDLDHLRAAYYAAGKPKGVSDAQLSFFDVDLAG